LTPDGAYTTYPRLLMTDLEYDLPATSIIAGPDGNVWVGDREHRRIVSIDRDGVAHVVAQLPRGSDPEVLITDRHGDVWFNNRWTHPGTHPRYAVSRILADGRIDAARYSSQEFTPAAEDQGGNVWYVRSGKQLARIDSSGAVTRFDVPLHYLNTVAVAPDGTIWAGGTHGLTRLDDHGRFQPIRRATYWEVSSLYPAPDGRLWLTYFTADYNEHAAWLPPNPCLSRRRITVHLRARQHDPILRATVIVRGRRAGRTFRRPRTVDIDLRGYLPGRARVRIEITSQHRRYTLNRVFRTCATRHTPSTSS
jgi:streptogramin lyase